MIDAWNRRTFLRWGTTFLSGVPLALASNRLDALAQSAAPAARPATGSPGASRNTVAVASCRSYGPEVQTALGRCFDLLGGIGSLVKGKAVTVKINLTGTNFAPFL